MGNEALLQAAAVMNFSKKIEDDLKKLGLRVKRYEDKIKLLTKQKNRFDEDILNLQVTLAECRTSNEIGRGYLPNVVCEYETVQHIRKHENSAAAILYKLINCHGTEVSDNLQNCGVVGIVATLGKVDDSNISRLLSEYLGTKTMLAVVFDTLKNAKDMEYRDKEVSIYKNSGVHKLGESIGRTIDGRFLVICLEKLRPYVGEFIADDPQRRLDLLKPRLPGGEVPRGFLGFAVNMISIDKKNLFSVTPKGHGLRETLFYHLFSHMQVYRSKEDMLQALPFITDGAISLDGGMIRSTGMFFLGYMEEPDIIFPKNSGTSPSPADYFALEEQLKEKKWEHEVLLEELQREKEFLEQVKFHFYIKKQEYLQFMEKLPRNGRFRF